MSTPPPFLRLQSDGRPDDERRAAQDAVNPKYVPRQHLLQYAVEGAEAGDPTELEALMKVWIGGTLRCACRMLRDGEGWKDLSRMGEGRISCAD